jgi:hypothetical protein
MNAVRNGWRVLALAAVVAGCDGGGGTSASVATSVTATSAISQTGVTETAVAQAPAVRVLDQRGDPMGGVAVTFVANGAGSVAATMATTDAGGNASAGGWTLGPQAGVQTVRATAGTLPPVMFSASAQSRTPTTMVAASAATQTGVAGAVVAEAPTVRVTDQLNQPMAGVRVDFAVTAGGGEVATASASTDVTGTAATLGWTLGAAGQNTVTATVTGVAPVQFTATAAAPVATTVTALTPVTQVGVAGGPVSMPPMVQVKDQAGNPMLGVPVTFTITAGGGSLSGVPDITWGAGTASVSAWTLGATPGRNAMTVTVAGLPPVEFEATGAVPVATALQAVSPTTQSAPVGTAVAQRPSVRVNDQAGQPMAGVPVTFTVTAGGGSVTGGTATTNAAGVATVGSWTLGPAAGQNTVTATTGSLAPVTFSATGTSGDPCTASVAYTPGSSVSGALATTDCRLSSGEYVDFYSTRLASAQAISFTMSSTAVDSWLEMYDAGGNLVGFNDDAGSGSNNAALRVFAPSGDYFLAATSFAAGETGAYQLASSGLTGNTNCGIYWVVPGVTISGSVATTDCSSGGYYSDGYFVILRPGQTLTVRMQSTAVDSYLGLYNLSGALVTSDDDSGGGNNALLTYTYTGTTVTAFYIDAGTYSTGQTGAYTLTVTRS